MTEPPDTRAEGSTRSSGAFWRYLSFYATCRPFFGSTASSRARIHTIRTAISYRLSRLYLIYLKRSELKAIRPSSSLAGLWLIISALIIHVLGEIAVINFVSSFSMVLYIAGAVLYLMGREFSEKIAFPVLFLIFMCPVPDNIINWAALPMKSLSTTLALKLVDLSGIPYIREGSK
jgi:exosortase